MLGQFWGGGELLSGVRGTPWVSRGGRAGSEGKCGVSIDGGNMAGSGLGGDLFNADEG